MLSELRFSSHSRLPVILQTEATECGLACLTMIAQYYGHDVNLNGMRVRHPVSLKGLSLEGLINLAGHLDLGARALRLDLEVIDHLQLPAILHWDLNHFVVLKEIRGQKFIIHDPARGKCRMSLTEVSNHFTGVALEMVPTTGFNRQRVRNHMKFSSLWSKLVGLKRAIVQTLILSIILQITILAAPFYLQLVVDEVIVALNFNLLLILALGFGALSVLNAVTAMMRSWAILFFGHQMSFQIVTNIFRHLLHLPVDYFEKRHVGDIMSRMGSTNPIQIALTQSIAVAIIDGLMAVVTGIIIFVYSVLLGAVVIISVLLLIMVTLAFYPILRQQQEEAIVMDAKKDSHVIESVRASTTIKLFSAQNQRLSIWRNILADSINSNILYGKYKIYLTAFQTFITGLQTILVVYIGARLILTNEVNFTLGMLFAFMSYRQNFTQSITSLIDKFIEFRLLSLHLERIADITQSQTESISYDIVSTNLESVKPAKIELRDLRFRYSENDPWVLDGINLTIQSGEFVAITGPSGGGKTTLLKVILGLYMPTEGQVLIDGQPLTDATRLSWRRSIGVVMQDDQLLTGSIADNISFFDPQMNIEKVKDAAGLACIHEDIMKMPMSYLSLVGDMGSALSGGQKQRVLLARAFYRFPKTLFLDEGTANIDVDTERQIADIISDQDITRIIVAHRPEFISKAEREIKICNGKIHY